MSYMFTACYLFTRYLGQIQDMLAWDCCMDFRPHRPSSSCNLTRKTLTETLPVAVEMRHVPTSRSLGQWERGFLFVLCAPLKSQTKSGALSNVFICFWVPPIKPSFSFLGLLRAFSGHCSLKFLVAHLACPGCSVL